MRGYPSCSTVKRVVTTFLFPGVMPARCGTTLRRGLHGADGLRNR